MNKLWHDQNPFPETATEDAKEQWRNVHAQNCSCGNMAIPYRQKSRDE